MLLVGRELKSEGALLVQFFLLFLMNKQEVMLVVAQGNS